jgi:hypothetical protein
LINMPQTSPPALRATLSLAEDGVGRGGADARFALRFRFFLTPLPKPPGEGESAILESGMPRDGS